jgi:hypothetical protein
MASVTPSLPQQAPSFEIWQYGGSGGPRPVWPRLYVFTQVFQNGEQVWVLVRAGQIVNAGVNQAGAHY